MLGKYLIQVMLLGTIITCVATLAVAADATTTTLVARSSPLTSGTKSLQSSGMTEEQKALLQEINDFRKPYLVYEEFLKLYETKLIPMTIEREKYAVKLRAFQSKEGDAALGEAMKVYDRDKEKVEKFMFRQIAGMLLPICYECTDLLEKHKDLAVSPKEKQEFLGLTKVLENTIKDTSYTLTQNPFPAETPAYWECQKELGGALTQCSYIVLTVLRKLPQEMNKKKELLLKDMNKDAHKYGKEPGVYDPFEESLLKGNAQMEAAIEEVRKTAIQRK
jgi:hypothetical protein